MDKIWWKRTKFEGASRDALDWYSVIVHYFFSLCAPVYFFF